MQKQWTFSQNQLSAVMNQLSHMEFTYSSIDHVKLDQGWNTDNFPLTGKISSRSRIYLPLAGKGYGKMKDQRLVFRPGFIYLIPPFTNIHVSCNRFLEKYYVHFNVKLTDLDMDLFSCLKFPYALPVENRELLISAFEILMKIIKQTCLNKKKLNEMDRLESNAAMTMLIMPFLRAVENNIQLQDYDDNRIIRMQQFIETHLEQRDLLKMLADEFQMNSNYLSNFYKDKMGLPLNSYVNSRRVFKAVVYLTRENFQIKEISWRLGYDHPRSFARFFKNQTGFSPEEYRQKFMPVKIQD